MLPPLDIIDRPIAVGDYVAFSNNVYVVQVIGKTGGKHAPVKIMMANPSKTTRPQTKTSGNMCLIPREDIIVWRLKHAGA